MTIDPPGLDSLMLEYRAEFASKKFDTALSATDPLMDAFAITPALKATHPQYWSRQLGALWEKIVARVLRASDPATVVTSNGDTDNLCDIVFRGMHIEVKYRIGSGDAQFAQNLEANGRALVEAGRRAVLLILRDDSLPKAVRRARKAGWEVLVGTAAFTFLAEETGYRLDEYLRNIRQIAA